MLRTTLVCALSLALSASAQKIDLRGVIINQASFPVEGLIVQLAEANIVDTTDSEGRFSLHANATAVVRNHAHRASPNHITFGPEHVEFTIEKPTTALQIRVFDASGSMIGQPLSTPLPAGHHRIPLQQLLPRSSASGMFIAELRCNDRIDRIPLLCSDGTVRAAGRQMPEMESFAQMAPSLARRSAATDEARDTLIVVRYGNEELRAPIAKLEDSVMVALDLVPYEIVALAVDEKGEGPGGVGEKLKSYPHDLDRYLATNEAWCSEFVSWAYRATGYPFTAGYEDGGWMLKGSRQIKRWFELYARFVTSADSDWEDFTPAPGDYIRFDNDWGGHSGIVCYASNDTLYTVEGNVGNKVYLRRYPAWKSRKDIDGIGMRSGTGKRVRRVLAKRLPGLNADPDDG
jgi:hypothetical protein